MSNTQTDLFGNPSSATPVEADAPTVEAPQPPDPRQRDFSLGFALICDCGKPAHLPHCCACGN